MKKLKSLKGVIALSRLEQLEIQGGADPNPCNKACGAAPGCGCEIGGSVCCGTCEPWAGNPPNYGVCVGW